MSAKRQPLQAANRGASPPGYSCAMAFLLGVFLCAPNVHAAIVAELKADSSPSKAVAETIATKVDDSTAEDSDQRDELTLGRRFVILNEKDRPAWVTAAGDRSGEGVHTAIVSSDPYTTRHECEQALKKQVAAAVDDYVQWYLGHSSAAQRVRFSPEYIEKNLIGATYVEDIDFINSSLGRMKEMHARLDFDADFRREVSQRWENKVKSARLLQAGFVVAGVLGLLVVVFGFLKTDTATGGSHGLRLKAAAIAVILALLATGVLTARWIPWI